MSSRRDRATSKIRIFIFFPDNHSQITNNSSPPQPHHIPKWKAVAGESARGDDPEGGVDGWFVGKVSEAVGQVDEDGGAETGSWGRSP